MSDTEASVAERSINTIRFLAVDAIEKAHSGHPGLPMGGAAMAYVLWTRHLKYNPANPKWMDRDRFVLSAGHGSMLLYAMLHLTGYDLSLEDIKAFRTWGSKTPGHPEFPHTPGVEVTTGPLGQGMGNAVGMAIAEAYLAARYNDGDRKIIDHYTYVMAGDGDLMEGIAAEACSLAGHLGLGKLIVLYDDNKISLAGSTNLSFSEDVPRRFQSCGWHVVEVDNGNDIDAIDGALQSAKAEADRPSLIALRTQIGFGAPTKAGTYQCHGAPLGAQEVQGAKERLGWPVDEEFFIPDDVQAHMGSAVDKGREQEAAWRVAVARYRDDLPDLAAEFDRITAGDLPEGWDAALPRYETDAKGISTRKVSEAVMQSLASALPELIGGTADLNPSTLAWVKGYGDFQNPRDVPGGIQGSVGEMWNYGGRNIHFGVREHAMGAIASGLALHGGIIPFTGTFFTFSDYMRPSMRLAALMGLHAVYVFSHDSIGVGEDGPTHQPVEHLMSLRVMPNMTVMRPADAAETVEAWHFALCHREGPTALVVTRQDVPILDREKYGPARGLQKGGYVLWDSGTGNPDIILIGTGSELQIALDAGKELAARGVAVRVVSLPSWEVFDRQPEEYREGVLPAAVRRRIAVEAAITVGWERYVGMDGIVIGMHGFGASAPASVLYEKFGITARRVVEAAETILA